ncbi:MAG: hypothetical protein CMI54_01365 [Parcubacteria group bacterium]|nr:hypothetical protein [Parcubacteria group bacterium]
MEWWFILGILSGLFNGLAYTVSKKALSKMSPALASIGFTLFSLPYFVFMLLWSGWAVTDFTFWWSTILAAVVNVGGFLLLMKALKIGNISQVIPFLSFTPLFLLVVSNLMLGEFPNSSGLLGVVIIVGGAYIVQLDKEGGFLGPFKSIMKSKATKLVLATAFLYSITSTLSKVAILNSNPMTFLIVYQGLAGLILIPLMQKSEQKVEEFRSHIKPLALMGLLEALTLICQMIAVSTGLVSYIVSLKRTSAIWSVVLGYFIFREKNIKLRLIGASLMIIGIVLISQG